MPGHYNLVPNCPGAEVSWCRSVPRAVCLSRLLDTGGTGKWAIVPSACFIHFQGSVCVQTGKWQFSLSRHVLVRPVQTMLFLCSDAEVSHTNRCRSVRTVRHRTVPRTLRHQNLVPKCPGAEVSVKPFLYPVVNLKYQSFARHCHYSKSVNKKLMKKVPAYKPYKILAQLTILLLSSSLRNEPNKTKYKYYNNDKIPNFHSHNHKSIDVTARAYVLQVSNRAWR